MVLKIAHAGMVWVLLASVIGLGRFSLGQIGYEYAIFSGWACEVLKDW